MTFFSSDRTGRGRSYGSGPNHPNASRVASWSATRLADHSTFHAPASSRETANVRSGPTKRRSSELKSDFVIRPCCGCSFPAWSAFSLTKENWQERLSQPHSPAQNQAYNYLKLQILFSFSSDKDRRTDSRIRRAIRVTS